MTVATIQQRLIAIGLLVREGSHGQAHDAEQSLHAETLRAIADGKAGSREAREALRSFEIDFERWHA